MAQDSVEDAERQLAPEIYRSLDVNSYSSITADADKPHRYSSYYFPLRMQLLLNRFGFGLSVLIPEKAIKHWSEHPISSQFSVSVKF